MAEAVRRGAGAVHHLDVDAPAGRRLRVPEAHDAAGHAEADARGCGAGAVVDDDGARARPATAGGDPPEPVAPAAGRGLLRKGRDERRTGGGVEVRAALVDGRRRAGVLATTDHQCAAARATRPQRRGGDGAGRVGDHRQRARPGGTAIAAGGAGRAGDGGRLAAVVPHQAADVIRLHHAAAAQPGGAAASRAAAVVRDHRRTAPVLVAETEGVTDLVRGDLLEQALRPAAGGDAHLGRHESAASVSRRPGGAGDAEAGQALGAVAHGADLDARAVGWRGDEDHARAGGVPRRHRHRRGVAVGTGGVVAVGDDRLTPEAIPARPVGVRRHWREQAHAQKREERASHLPESTGRVISAARHLRCARDRAAAPAPRR